MWICGGCLNPSQIARCAGGYAPACSGQRPLRVAFVHQRSVRRVCADVASEGEPAFSKKPRLGSAWLDCAVQRALCLAAVCPAMLCCVCSAVCVLAVLCCAALSCVCSAVRALLGACSTITPTYLLLYHIWGSSSAEAEACL